ncbi:hypothetical protein G5I_07996 [Acromyrmex echinatior]|uniref:Uncharacterized protein n=1 Tax=Acromyrmex echinatior TaxID=103372 RepID=F4WQB1_ACREC|nr:hypothetical protein G5I_07996 [Acromyrmex echinatior]
MPRPAGRRVSPDTRLSVLRTPTHAHHHRAEPRLSVSTYPATSGFILGRGEVPPLRRACKSLVRHENRGVRPLLAVCGRPGSSEMNPCLADPPAPTRVPASEFSSWGECRPLLAGVCQLQPMIGPVTNLHLPVSPSPLYIGGDGPLLPTTDAHGSYGEAYLPLLR